MKSLAKEGSVVIAAVVFFLFGACRNETHCDVPCTVETADGTLGPFKIGASKADTLATVRKEMSESEIMPTLRHQDPIFYGGDLSELMDAPVINVAGKYDSEFGGHPTAILKFSDRNMSAITVQGERDFELLFEQIVPGQEKKIVLEKIEALLSANRIASASGSIDDARAFLSRALSDKEIDYLLQYDSFLIANDERGHLATYKLSFSNDRLNNVRLSRIDAL